MIYFFQGFTVSEWRGIEVSAGGARSTGGAAAECAAEGAELGGAASALVSVLGMLEGDSVLPIDRKSPTMSVRGGGGGGG
ncbi:MAG: hypothetical protein ACMG6S_10680 [Byssovorax sp.]